MQYIYPLIFPKLSSETHTKIKNFVYATASFHIKNIKDLFPEYVEQDNFRQSYHNKTNTSQDVGEYCNWLMTEDLINEIRNDLTDEIYPFSKMDFYFQYMHGGSVIAPHKDSPRNMSFLYMIYENQGVTHFYKDLINQPNRVLFDLNEIEGPIQSYKMKQHHWYVMKHDVIHSVTNVNSVRLQIVGNFTKDFHYEKWIAENSNLLDTTFDNFLHIDIK